MNCCDIIPGMLRHRITFKRNVATPDGIGGSVIVPTDVIDVAAFIKPVSGNERWQSMRIESNVTHRIYTRYRAGITPDLFIQYGLRKFQVKAVLNLEESNQWLEIHAVEGEAV